MLIVLRLLPQLPLVFDMTALKLTILALSCSAAIALGPGGAGAETVYVDKFTDGVLDPARPFLGPVKDGGHVIANTAPGCWGPMITPSLTTSLSYSAL